MECSSKVLNGMTGMCEYETSQDYCSPAQLGRDNNDSSRGTGLLQTAAHCLQQRNMSPNEKRGMEAHFARPFCVRLRSRRKKFLYFRNWSESWYLVAGKVCKAFRGLYS
ncbi:hypothetical protein AVEN_130710-1 [Araneus ventricosus]|uniref:Uncharacterized protein n=1 Tax=Araneus ventricosus TaxID=182803 RepID=A0A4Y2FDF7_ARAVE|nr:hypothetical protein AVEN_130710-1 [Araneus ventricosus]